MYINIFPKSLSGLLRQHYGLVHFEAVMLPLISLQEYLDKAAETTAERLPLSEIELNQARSYKVPKRQKEWLTGRICAKMAAMHYIKSRSDTSSPVLPASVLVENNVNGRPFLSGASSEKLAGTDISLSHGGGYGASVISDTYCGIDIQESRDSLKRVREKFCTVEEEDLLTQNLADLSDLQHLTLLWTAKEAAKKALSSERMPGFLELFLTTIEPHMSGWILNFVVSARNFDQYPPTLSVAADLYDGFGIAACLMEKSADA